MRPTHFNNLHQQRVSLLFFGFRKCVLWKKKQFFFSFLKLSWIIIYLSSQWLLVIVKTDNGGAFPVVIKYSRRHMNMSIHMFAHWVLRPRIRVENGIFGSNRNWKGVRNRVRPGYGVCKMEMFILVLCLFVELGWWWWWLRSQWGNSEERYESISSIRSRSKCFCSRR